MAKNKDKKSKVKGEEKFYYLAKRDTGAHIFVTSEKDLKKYEGNKKRALTSIGKVSIIQRVDLIEVLQVKGDTIKL